MVISEVDSQKVSEQVERDCSGVEGMTGEKNATEFRFQWRNYGVGSESQVGW